MPAGWGLDEWGISPWGISGTGAATSLPSEPPFDIYCIDHGDFINLLTFPEISYLGDIAGSFYDPVAQEWILGSGGVYPTSNARLEYNTAVPAAFTLEVGFRVDSLPQNFTDLVNRHVFIGVTDAQGASAGIFISQIGLLYTGVVHFIGGAIVLDSPAQYLPNSQALIETGVQLTMRLAVSYDNNATYIYWTHTDEIPDHGHLLRYVLPAFNTAESITPQPDRAIFSVRGTDRDASILALDNTCLGTGLIIPNLPPRADAGPDQALRTCAIAQLDGSRSFDPEGSAVLYKWRLIDAPVNSKFSFESLDAITYPAFPVTGFTDKIYSIDLATEDALDPFAIDDVIVIASEPHDITAKGIDGNGFYVQVEAQVIPDNLSGAAYKVLRQRGLSGITLVNPRFLPDVTGLFKFDLVVFDGELFSDPSVSIINVTESPIPRGIIPDLRFIWDYLGDFWKLVEDRERLEVFWGALAQVSAAELLTLWQTDYAKSLRDIQRTFQRRWLHYDLLLKEQPGLIEFSTTRTVYGGIESDPVDSAGIAGVAGNTLDLFLSTQEQPVSVFFSGSGLLTAQGIADRINGFMGSIDPRVQAKVITFRDNTAAIVRIDAPFAMSVSSTSTVSIFGVRSNSIPKGSAGVVIGSKTYRTEKSLTLLGIQEGDFLTVGEGTYRIARIIDDPNDPLPFQRVSLLDEIPFNAGPNWLISGQTTSQSWDFYAALLTSGDVATIEVIDTTTNVISYVQVPATGASPVATDTLGIDSTLLGRYLSDERYQVHFFSATRRHFTPISDLVSDVPYLQERVKNEDDTKVLRRNIDFFVDSYRGHKCLRFAVSNNISLDIWEGEVPPDRMWAETTYLDNRPTVEANFGIPAEFTLDDLSTLPENIDYLSAVRGLWYAYFNGPTMFNIRAGTQILLGLPFAEVAGTIEEIRDDFSTTTGRVLLRDVQNPEIVRSYSYPHGLDLETNPATKEPYKVGDTVPQFAPIVEGVNVIDYVKDPKWFETLLNQGSFSEVEKYFKFLVRVDSQAFNLSALLFVQTFIRRIKPTYTFPLFIVRQQLKETEVSVSDVPLYKGTLVLFAGPFFSTTSGQAQMWDQPRPGGGGYWNHYDVSDPNNPPTPFTPTLPSIWGHDNYLLAPEESLDATMSAILLAPTVTPSDSLFYVDLPAFTTIVSTFNNPEIFIAGGAGTKIGISKTSAVTATINRGILYIRALDNNITYTLDVHVNGVSAYTTTFLITPSPEDPGSTSMLRKFPLTLAVPVVPGDVLEMFIAHPTTGDSVFFELVALVLGEGIDIAADTMIPAGTYYIYLGL